MIARKHIGRAFPPYTSLIEAGRVRLYCETIGETAPIRWDAQIARSAGYRNILAPSTFPTVVSMDNPNPQEAALARHSVGSVAFPQAFYIVNHSCLLTTRRSLDDIWRLCCAPTIH
jgi:hypothetical protein